MLRYRLMTPCELWHLGLFSDVVCFADGGSPVLRKTTDF